ncbi:uncharacterized protein LOC121374855 [Gigantopelta aegis]|uniref:uncharacterized protein LOC121374855 n=1 Tax=Gigantopelta aegis TaxID=1735272 RepID=UPI001B889519|nr:uncharacterized protein LOC121374855 [Gigantopelta aegis]
MDNDDLDSDLEIIEESSTCWYADGSNKQNGVGSKQKYSLLESVSERFEQNRRERESRIETMRTKREVEVAHSQYLKNEVVSREELNHARPIVNAWAQKHDKVEKATRRVAMSKDRQFHSPYRARRGQPPYDVTQRSHTGLSVSSAGTSDRHVTAGHSSNSSDTFVSYDPSVSVDTSMKYVCPVVNCKAWYMSRHKYRDHKHSFSHSPCNPCLSLADSELPQRPQFYICPKCGDIYQRKIECQEHMIMNGHLSLFSPLAIVAFACPQCLTFYDDQARCSQHMANAHHSDVSFPFSGDFDRAGSQDPFTIPIPQSLAEDFIIKCAEVPFHVMCTECNFLIKDHHHMKHHGKKTAYSHFLSSHADSTPAGVFSMYLSGTTCTSCDQILHPSDFVDDCHRCDRGLTGRRTELNCKTMKEFVRRVGLTLERKASSAIDITSELDEKRGLPAPQDERVASFS